MMVGYDTTRVRSIVVRGIMSTLVVSLICATVCFAVIGVRIRRVVSIVVVRSHIIIRVLSVSIVVSKF